MKRFFISCFLISLITISYSQNYNISFTGTGASTTVTSVKVENITQKTSLILSGTDILNLKDVSTNITEMQFGGISDFQISPNPMQDKCDLSFMVASSQTIYIAIFELSGKLETQLSVNVSSGLQGFTVGGLQKGLYVVQVLGSDIRYKGKLVSNGNFAGNPYIEYIGLVTANNSNENLKALNAKIVEMNYHAGDKLLYTATSGIYSTKTADVPTNSKTINIKFEVCTDADNNNYGVVKIGTQTWMASNLNTTHFKDKSAILNVTDNVAWEALTSSAFCYFNNDINNKPYGALYTWWAATDVRSICPPGWHLPSLAEWTVLENYLSNNGYGYQGSGKDVAKSLASASNWMPTAVSGQIGNDQLSNNTSGFNAVAAGGRHTHGGSFGPGLKDTGGWWVSDADAKVAGYAYYRTLMFNGTDISPNPIGSFKKGYGWSVRCIKD